VLYIERDDFREDPPKEFFRLAPGREVRLRYAYFVKCVGVVKNPATGEVTELHCTYDPATRGGDAPDKRKVKATLHWVSAERSCPPPSACTTTCSPSPTAGCAGRAGFHHQPEPQLAGNADELPRGTEPFGRGRRRELPV